MDGKPRLTFGKGERAQVAIVTGAARGLGRAWAIALAERGARVVVNDNDPDRSLVDGVVRAIREAGGTAAPDYHSVTDGAKVVQTALDHFKRVDILINVRVGVVSRPTFAFYAVADLLRPCTECDGDP